MERTEQEQIAALIATLVTQSIKDTIRQVFQEEQSVFFNQINSQLTETLKSHLQEQLAKQRREFEVELQAKIDELKFQHYQQLERLGQAVEQVMTLQPVNEISVDNTDEIADEITDESYDEVDQELELFKNQVLHELGIADDLETSEPLESELNLFAHNESEPLSSDEIVESLESETDLNLDQESNLFADSTSVEKLNDDLNLENNASEFDSQLPPNQAQDILETSDPFAILNNDQISSFANEETIEDELDYLEPEKSEIPDDLSLINLGFDLNDDLSLEVELNLLNQPEFDAGFDDSGTISTESDLFMESAALDDLSDSLNLETLENTIAPDDSVENDPFSQEVFDSSDRIDQQVISPEFNEFAEQIILEENLGSLQYSVEFLEAIAQSEIETNQELQFNEIEPEAGNQVLTFDDQLNEFAENESVFDFSDDATSEFNEFDLELMAKEDQNVLSSMEDVEDSEVDPFAFLIESTKQIQDNSDSLEWDFDALEDSPNLDQDILNQGDDNQFNEFVEMTSIGNPLINFDDTFDSGIDEFDSILADNIEGIETSDTYDPFTDFDESPEIVYEGEEDQFTLELNEALQRNLNIQALAQIAELAESDRLSIELERELDIAELPPINISNLIPEIEDEELSNFADLEEDEFWQGDRSESPSNLAITNIWHLGIDFGYTAIRACLFNQGTKQIYPLLINEEEQISANIVIKREKEEINIQGVKQFLRLGIPFQHQDQYQKQYQDQWQPQLEWANKQKLSLKDLLTPVQSLLAQIKESATHPDLEIAEVFDNLETVILAHPHSWSDAYIFNIREVVLASGLVSSVEQVLVIDQAIASFFNTLFNPVLSSASSLPDQQLFIDAGGFTTTLSFSFYEENRFNDLEYAGLGINQDIVLQLLYPQTKGKFPATKFIKSGIPSPHRIDLQHFLNKSAIGIEALAIAEQIKLFFSQNPEASIWQGHLGGKSIKISSLDLEVKVIQPYIQCLNDAIDLLIAGTLPEDILNIAIAGGTSQLPSIRQWLESKFANAQVSELPCTYLAQSLAIAPLYAQYLNISRHQYSDYFLLSEVCALNLQEPLSLEELVKKLQSRGVNKTCSDRLSKILLKLPAGILPWQEPEKSLILADPALNQTLLTNSLFTSLAPNLYTPNPAYTQTLSSYLKLLESSNNQSFSEPLVFPSFVN